MQARTHKVSQARRRPHKLVIDGLCEIELLPAAGYRASYTPPHPVIGFGFDAQSGVHAFASSRRSAFYARPNHLSWVPAGCDIYSQSDKGGEYLKITLYQIVPRCHRAEHRFSNVIDPIAIGAAHRLRSDLIASNPADPLGCARHLRILMDRIACHLTGRCAEPRAASWMTPRRLRHVDELIEAGLDKRLAVHELAAALGLSAGFFSRAFRAATGKAPYDYIIDRRVARARMLLQVPDFTLSNVAYASGFSSHAHMSAVFRERLGATPSDIRRTAAH